MKKTYSKPEFFFESFLLSGSIANVCEVGTNYAQGTCGYKFAPGVIIFTSNVSGCAIQTFDGDPLYDGICYHNPEDTNNIFNS